ncbi:MAG: YwmB family TATA-box binding protein [Firmicutes bacterium]|nr:YwmB family TATA-box binding protein [Bacillota bacterium]
MKRWHKIVIILFLLAAATIIYRIPRREVAGIEALEMVVTTAGATVTEGEAQFFSILDNQYRELDELETVLLEVAALLGVKGNTIEKGEGETFRVVDTVGKTAAGSLSHIVVQSNPGDGNGVPPQTYLLVVCNDISVAAIATGIEQLNEVLQPYAPAGQISYYVSGQVAGKKNSEEMEQMARTALTAVRGSIVEGMQDEELISYTAYTPLLERYMTIDGDRFNVNVAIRYDSFLEQTVVWAGFPLIHDSY